MTWGSRVRYAALSGLLHMIVVLVLSGTVLYRHYVDPPDFTASDGGLVTDRNSSGLRYIERDQGLGDHDTRVRVFRQRRGEPQRGPFHEQRVRFILRPVRHQRQRAST